MIFCTSISPTHVNKDIQLKAIKSWQELGGHVYSFNHPSEIAQLKSQYNHVTFIHTDRTFELTYGKPLVSISAVLDWIKANTNTHFCIINSDIELRMNSEMLLRIREEMKTSIVLANRIDYEENNSGKEYYYGIDVFFIHKQFIGLYPQSMFCFGQCFWDYEIPYKALKSGVEVTFIKQQIAWHKAHKMQYNNDDWAKSGRYFLWHNNLYQFNHTQEIGKMSTYIYNFIYNGSQRKEI